ncbi:hypothetical protein [Azospirillum sp.]|uniref:hypothetical protein n=1 Tax=Azospirillum sp. TaxID=34012 RepID=UPI002D3B12EC|nr:hypothetical protein [Azospirillum sp.]HYD68500.1 hypothetical protein [Azospirillum sp.]
MTVRSYLAKFQPELPADDSEIRSMAAAAWHRRRGLFITTKDLERMRPGDRETIERVGARLSGRRSD